MDENVGAWELVFLDASTNKATLDRYNVPPEYTDWVGESLAMTDELRPAVAMASHASYGTN